MQTEKGSILAKEGTISAISVIAVILGFATGVCAVIEKQPENLFTFFVAIITLALFLSYKKHNKNLMKGLLGAVLMWMTVEEYTFVTYKFFTAKEETMLTFGELYKLFAVLIIFALITNVAILFLHFLINSDRRSSPVEVSTNRLLCVFLALLHAADIIMCLAVNDRLWVGTYVLLAFKIMLTLTVLCIEAKLDESRLKREAEGFEIK